MLLSFDYDAFCVYLYAWCRHGPSWCVAWNAEPHNICTTRGEFHYWNKMTHQLKDWHFSVAESCGQTFPLAIKDTRWSLLRVVHATDMSLFGIAKLSLYSEKHYGWFSHECFLCIETVVEKGHNTEIRAEIVCDKHVMVPGQPTSHYWLSTKKSFITVIPNSPHHFLP